MIADKTPTNPTIRNNHLRGLFPHQDLVQTLLQMASPLFTLSFYYPPHGKPSSRQNQAKWLYASVPFQVNYSMSLLHLPSQVSCVRKIFIFKTNNILNQLFTNALKFLGPLCCALISTQHFALPSSELPPSPFTVGPRTPGLHKLGPWKTSEQREKRDTWWKQGEGCLVDGVFQHSDGAKS